MPLVTQRRSPEYAEFVENARWTVGGVVFATVHVVGSNNNRDPERAGAMAEFAARDRANEAWVRAAFAEAKATGAPGLELFFQAQPFQQGSGEAGRPEGLRRFLDTVEEESVAFGRPVLLVHSDEHRYRLEIGKAFEVGGAPRANVTRLETFGASDLHGVVVTVDPASAQVFLAGPPAGSWKSTARAAPGAVRALRTGSARFRLRAGDFSVRRAEESARVGT